MGKWVSVDPRCYIVAAFGIMLLPIRWILGAVLAAAFHELCHMAMIIAMGGTIHCLTIRPSGAVICMDLIAKGKELLCAAAGPAGSFMLLFVSKWFPEVALCGLVQGIFNLLPVYPLDGGRIVKCMLAFLSPERAEGITKRISGLVAMGMTVASLLWGFLPGFLLFAGLIRTSLRKIPCKERKLAVQ